MKTSSPKKAQDFNDKAISFIALSELYLPFGNALCHYNAVALPGDCHATLAMTQYFVRNGTIFCLLKVIAHLTYTLYAIACNALYVIARSNATWQSPGRDTIS